MLRTLLHINVLRGFLESAALRLFLNLRYSMMPMNPHSETARRRDKCPCLRQCLRSRLLFCSMDVGNESLLAHCIVFWLQSWQLHVACVSYVKRELHEGDGTEKLLREPWRRIKDNVHVNVLRPEIL